MSGSHSDCSLQFFFIKDFSEIFETVMHFLNFVKNRAQFKMASSIRRKGRKRGGIMV